MSNQTGFYSHCIACGAMLRSKQRLLNHEALRCAVLKRRRKHQEEQEGKKKNTRK